MMTSIGMNRFALLALVVAAGAPSLAATPGIVPPVCLPQEFTTKQAVYVTEENVIVSRTTFSIPRQHSRVDTYDNDGQITKSILVDYIGQSVWSIEWTTPPSCTHIPIALPPLTRTCYENAVQRKGPADPNKLGKRRVSRWVVSHNGVDVTDLLVAGMPRRDGTVHPMRIVSRLVDTFVVVEYWDFKPRVDPLAFEVPAFCTTP